MTNSASRPSFQTATPPATTPHMGSAASNRLAWVCSRPAVMMPPSEWPHAIVRVGVPTMLSAMSRVAIWSGIASCRAQPVWAYEEPARA